MGSFLLYDTKSRDLDPTNTPTAHGEPTFLRELLALLRIITRNDGIYRQRDCLDANEAQVGVSLL